MPSFGICNIAYEGSSVEISAELRGEECQCVVYLPVSLYENNNIFLI
jgi:hypothetical protein